MPWERSHDEHGRRWLPWVLVAVAAAALLVSLLQVAQDARLTVTAPPSERSSDHRSVVIAPLPVGFAHVGDTAVGAGPRLPAAPDITVVAVDDLGRVQFVDVLTGNRRRLDLPALPVDATRIGVDTMIEVGDHIIMDANDAVVTVDPRTRIVTIVLEDRRVVPTTSTTVWLVDDFRGVTAVATRFDPSQIDDSDTYLTVRLPAMAHAVAGSRDHLVVALPERTITISTDGTSQQVAPGPAVASDGQRLAWLRCDRARMCRMVIGTVDDPDRTTTRVASVELPEHPAVLNGVFSPDGRLLAVAVERVTERAGARDGQVLIFEVADGTLRQRIALQGRPWTAPVAWSVDSRWLAVGAGRTIQMWSSDNNAVMPLDNIGVTTSIRGLLLSTSGSH